MWFMVESVLPSLLKSDSLRENLVNSLSACSVLETSTCPWLTSEKASLARENIYVTKRELALSYGNCIVMHNLLNYPLPQFPHG